MTSKASVSELQTLFAQLLLFGSFIWSFNLGIAVHEFGHMLAIWSVGITEVNVVLHPFLPSFTVWNVDNSYIGYVDALGPLFNVGLSSLVLALVWRKRQPMLLPLLLWAPIAYFSEGISMVVGLLSMGSDAQRIVTAGVPAGLVVSIGIMGMVLGIITLYLLFPLISISPTDSLSRKVSILGEGLGLYMFFITVYAFLLYPPSLSRNLSLFIAISLLVVILAVSYKPVYQRLNQISHTEIIPIKKSAVWIALILAGAIVVFQLGFFN